MEKLPVYNISMKIDYFCLFLGGQSSFKYRRYSAQENNEALTGTLTMTQWDIILDRVKHSIFQSPAS